MPYIDSNTRTSKTITTEQHKPLGRLPLLHGVYVGFVKDAEDVQRNGRLRVWIPDFGNPPDEEGGWTIVNYCSPFAGATNVDLNSKNTQIFEGTQTSYGMWMIPPDINNQVLVVFAGGDSAKGFWLGCLYNQYMNNMVPGMAASASNYQYPGEVIPVAEYNKKDIKVTQPDRTIKPYEATKFKGVGNQGLIKDQARGITTSSARRESPSKVFGILTPGPAIDEDAPPKSIRRKGGSSFIMDDKTGSEYVQIATKSGAQIKLDETNGFVYLINRDGTAWVELDKKGNINIFGATNISMRAQKDINLRADRNINIEAGQNLYMKAAMDTVTSETEFTYDVNNVPIAGGITYYKYVGEGAGEGGNIVTQALFNTHTTVAENSFVTIGKNHELKIGAKYDINAATEYNLTSPTIKNVGAVKMIGTLDVTDSVKLGKTLDVTEDVKLGKTLKVVDGINAKYGSFSDKVNASEVSSSGNITGADIIGNFPLLMPGPGASNGGPGQVGVPGEAVPAVEIPAPPAVIPAEVKPLVAKVNILAPWADPESKFIRLSEAVMTTTSMFPTYEPCPEHEQFIFAAVEGWNPPITEGQESYTGSGSAGGGSTKSPAPNTDPGANNTELPPTEASESAVSKNFNNKAFECQLKIHEGVKYKSYNDSLGLPTAGIGHLLREDEKAKYPIGTPVSEQQVSTWFESDSQTAISDAQRFVGTDTWNSMDDNRKRAVADLAYNMGGPRLNKFNGLRSALQKGDYDAAGESLKNSKWYTQVGRRGPAIISQVVNGTDPNGCDKKFPST